MTDLTTQQKPVIKAKRQTIALTYIIKDDSEADMFSRGLKSFMPYVDGLYVAITGPSGKHAKIKKLVKKYDGKFTVTTPEKNPKIYHEGKFANFAEARNVSWGLIDKKYDWWMWADVDDVLEGGDQFQTIAYNARREDMDAVFVPYFYAVKQDEKGQVTEVEVEHLKERFIKPNVYKWVSRLHEVIVPKDPNHQLRQTMYELDIDKGQTCVWIHLPGDDRVATSLDRNRMILEIQAEEEEYKDPRTLFYLAKIYYQYQKGAEFKKAEEYLYKYLEMSGWEEERANAWQYLGHIHTVNNNAQKAIEAYHSAIKEFPMHHISYLRLANAYFELGRNDYAKHWLKVAFELPKPSARTTIGQPLEVKLLSASLKFTEAQIDNDLEAMEYWAGVRAKLMGADDGLLEDVKKNKELNIGARGLVNFAQWLTDNGYKDRIEDLLGTVPKEMSEFPFVSVLANKIVKPKKWGKKSIVFNASLGGKHFEQWNHESDKKGGIGGSETAVINLAKQWAKKGYDVTVYADTDKVGKFDGVIWKPYFTFNWQDEFNILILWRTPWLLDHDVKAKKLYLDMHDVPSQAMFTPERVKKVDKIFVKSNFHRKLLPAIADNKFAIISNGINT